MLGLKKTKKNKSDIECKGLFWRASGSNFLSSHRSIESRKSLRLLKKRSCPGCEHCEWIWDLIADDVLEVDNYLDDIRAGFIYTFKVEGGMDYESGMWEMDGIIFVAVETSFGEKIK